MPDVTIDNSQYERFDLKTAPPDGYVMLRPLPYGMKLTRADKAMKMMQRIPANKRSRNQNEDMEVELTTMSEWAVHHDFAYCIGEHNLTDKNGTLLDFTNPMTMKILNPKVGSELQKHIDELNQDEDEETLEDFLRQRTSSSENEKNTLATVSPEQ